jgi:hypothetical protein
MNAMPDNELWAFRGRTADIVRPIAAGRLGR